MFGLEHGITPSREQRNSRRRLDHLEPQNTKSTAICIYQAFQRSWPALPRQSSPFSACSHDISPPSQGNKSCIFGQQKPRTSIVPFYKLQFIDSSHPGVVTCWLGTKGYHSRLIAQLSWTNIWKLSAAIWEGCNGNICQVHGDSLSQATWIKNHQLYQDRLHIAWGVPKEYNLKPMCLPGVSRVRPKRSSTHKNVTFFNVSTISNSVNKCPTLHSHKVGLQTLM